MTATTASAWSIRSEGKKVRPPNIIARNRKVVAFAREEPDLYDPEFQEYFQDLIERLDPMPTRMGALPPNPRDI
jgi:hypothetical protein